MWYHRIYIYHPFEPQSSLYITWLFIVSLAFMYNACAIPLRAAFDFQTPENIHWWFLGDYFCDLLYLVDIFLFKTSVKFVSNGVWVENRKEIIGRYFHSWRFKLDVAASMPLDLLYLVPQIGPISLLRLPKLLKLPSYWEFQSRVDQVARSPHLLRVMNSLAYMIWMIHANGCLFYYISKMEGKHSESVPPGTREGDHVLDEKAESLSFRSVDKIWIFFVRYLLVPKMTTAPSSAGTAASSGRHFVGKCRPFPLTETNSKSR